MDYDEPLGAWRGKNRRGSCVSFSDVRLFDEMIIYDAATSFLQSQVLDLLHTGIDITITTDPRQVKHTDICVFQRVCPGMKP